jgi:hypothetical protein
VRGCITSGEKWLFFVFKGPNALGDALKPGGEFHYSDLFELGEDLEDLSLVLGLLGDWVRAEYGS